MTDLNDFIFKYRYYIGGILILVILAGGGLLTWDKFSRGKTQKENNEISELRKQNELLRQQLSENSSKNIAGAATIENQNQSDKININSASDEELDKLPGIGPVKAADIIAYRESKGGFQTIEELKEVKGIGDKTFENLKDLVTVGE